MRRLDRNALAIALTLALPAAVAAQSGEPDAVSIREIRAHGRAHEVHLSVLDARGGPVRGVSAGDLQVTVDGRGVLDLGLEPVSKRYPALDVTLLIEPALTADATRRPVRELIARFAEAAGPRDRLEVVVPGVGAVGGAMSRASELAERLPEPRGAARPFALYDALFDAVRGARPTGGGRQHVLVAVTRGPEGDNRRGVVDVLAMAGASGRRVPIAVVLVEDQGGSPEGERLARLAQRSGGGIRRITAPYSLSDAAVPLATRIREDYLLRYRLPEGAAGTDPHELVVTVERGGRKRSGHLQYQAADVAAPAWWWNPAPWAALGGLLLLVVIGFLIARPRRLFRLVVEQGEETGCSYEVFALPLKLGAAAGNDITFPDRQVSRNHALLEARGRRIEILDLNSENGTFVNGDQVSRRVLADGDAVSLGGGVELIFEGRR